MKKKYFFFLILIFFSFKVNSIEKKVFIKKSVNEHTITNIDVENEVKFIVALNPKLSNVDKNKINKYAEDSLVNEKIKIIELSKYYEINDGSSLKEETILRFAKRFGINNLPDLKNYLKNQNILYKDLVYKIYIEHLWNMLIYKKFKNQVVIDEENIRKKIMNELENQVKKYKYFLHEIIYSVKNKGEIEIKTNEIIESIKKIGFENTANLYSVSESAKFNGKLGWINENQLSKKIIVELKKINIGEYTSPIKIRDGYIILFIKDKIIEEEEIDIDQIVKRRITYEMNNKLSEFSRQHFKKVAINQEIE